MDVNPPEPPAANPHPPVTEEDKDRVAFAELSMTKLLMSKPHGQTGDSALMHDQSIQLNIPLECLQQKSCLDQKQLAWDYSDSIKITKGVLAEYQHTHIIPWSFEKFKQNSTALSNEKNRPITNSSNKMVNRSIAMPAPILATDEYMLHSYVRFKNIPSVTDSESLSPWYHLDIIVTEDAQGHIQLRRFFMTPMLSPHVSMPPGVVC